MGGRVEGGGSISGRGRGWLGGGGANGRGGVYKWEEGGGGR